MISKMHPTRSHSGAAEGGINAALGNAAEDDPEKHAFYTVKGSDYLGDQDAIQRSVRKRRRHLRARALGRRLLAHRGWAHRPATVRRRRGAAHRYAADITGHVLMHVLYEQVMKRDLTVYEEWFAWPLVQDDGRCLGVICWDLVNGGLQHVGARR